MARKTARKRERSVIKGALAGLVGGIVGSGAKIMAEKFFQPRMTAQAPPPPVLVEQGARYPLSEAEERPATQGIHWAFGAIAGAVYGVAVEIEPKATAGRGAAFGLMLNKFTHESLLPKVGVAQPSLRQRTQQRQSEWVGHAVYGIATEATRRLLRRGL